MGSVSAPSHKQNFDHGALFSTSILDSVGGPGPVRRHRSMTPSHARNGEPARRPMTANSSDFSGGSPGSSTGSLLGGSRGYHPYAAYTSSSRTGSTQSSPSAFSIPLPGDYPSQQQMRRSVSRSSSISGMQEQMTQLMNISLDPSQPQSDPFGNEQASGGGAPPTFGQDIYRTDSPSSFPDFGTESFGQHGSSLPSHGAFPMDTTIQDQGQFGLPGMEHDPTFFSHSTHATSL